MPSVSFSTVGWSTWKVPKKVGIVTIQLDGAGSGSRHGGRVGGKMYVDDTQTLHILIGGAGKVHSGSVGGAVAVGGGGAGGNGQLAQAGGDGGGGASFIRVNSTTGTLKAVAAGAGGDSGDTGQGGSGGPAVGASGGRGTSGTNPTGVATGGTPAQGGNGGTSSSGSQFNGQNASDTELASAGNGGQASAAVKSHGGGGGGGGYHPGGGGQASSFGYAAGGGGGGGSSYIGGLTGGSYDDAGTGNGSLTITWTTPPPGNQPPSPPTDVKVGGVDPTDGQLTKSTGSVKIEAKLSDPDSKDTVKLLVRYANNSAMTGSRDVSSGFVARNKVTSVTLTGLAQNTHWYARLYTVDKRGLTSTSYTTIDFWTNKAPSSPTGLTINTQGEGMELPTLSSAMFSWVHNDDDVADYQTGFKLQYRKAATSVTGAGAWVVVDKTAAQNTSKEEGPPSSARNEWVFDPFTFKGNTFYEWQVQTRDGQGLVGAWSSLFTFHVASTTTPPVLLTPPTFTPVETTSQHRFTWRFVDPDAGDKQVNADFRYRAVGRTRDLAVGGISFAELDATNLATNPNLEGGVTTGWNPTDPSRYSLASSPVSPINGTRSLVVTRVVGTADITASSVYMTPPTGYFPCTPGTTISFGVNVRTPQNSRRARGWITWRDASLTIIGTSTPASITLVKDVSSRFAVSVIPPADAVYAAPVIVVESTVGNALNGEQVWLDSLRVGADGTYFDGTSAPSGPYTYRWTGAANASSSERYKNTGANPPPTEWVTLQGASAPGIPDGNTFWDIPANVFAEEYTYEWQVRTYDLVGGPPSDWADSFFFYAIRPPGSLSGPLPFGGATYAQGSLGCGSYRVFLYEQGGQRRLGEIEPIDHLTFTRLRDDISSCNVFTTGYSMDCGALYAQTRCWMHEMVVFRDGVRVWEGPITRIGYTTTSVEIEAKDVMAYAYRRIMRAGYNDAYRLVSKGVGNDPDIYLGLLSVVKRAALLLTQGLAPYDPNVLPYMTVIEYPDDARESRVVENWSRTVWEEVDDLAATAGLDYTTVGRRIILWDTHRAIGRLPEMRDGDFSDSPIVTEYGMQLANFMAVTNGSGVVGSVQVAAGVAPFGPIEMLASSYSDTAAASAEIQTPEALAQAEKALTEQAQRNISGRWPSPLVVRIPDNTTLSPKAGVGFQQLIPGVWLPLRSVNTPRQVVQWQKLDSVSVEVDDKGEKVHVVMSPAPNGGLDPDAAAAAEAAAEG